MRHPVDHMTLGHSIGATTLLALAGAQLWLGPGRRVPITPDARLERLVLLAPPTGFLRAPGALDALRTPLLVWVGTAGRFVSPAQGEWLAQAVPRPADVALRITGNAGHFSFRDRPPPAAGETLEDRGAFLGELARDVREFVGR